MAGRTPVLLLGGSAEATALAAWLARRPDVRPIASLKGLTPAPQRLADELVIGGFGGASRLARFLQTERIAILVDATHPYAQRMARNARRAARVQRIAHLKLWRPPWVAEPGDDWHAAVDVDDAWRLARRLGQRPFVSLGAGGLRQFPRDGFEHPTFRAVTRPAGLDAAVDVIEDQGPFTLAGELALFQRLATDVVVTKNAGGEATRAKLLAARALGLPVVMIRRPPDPPGPHVASVGAAEAWLEARLPPAVGPGFPGAGTAKPPSR